MTSFLYWILPFQTIILSITTLYTSRFTAVLWAVQLALFLPTSVMEVIEELAISTLSVPSRVWKRYVDDSFAPDHQEGCCL